VAGWGRCRLKWWRMCVFLAVCFWILFAVLSGKKWVPLSSAETGFPFFLETSPFRPPSYMNCIFEMVSSPLCEWAAPCARVLPFSNGLTVVLTMPVSSFIHIFCVGFRKGPKMRCRLPSAIPPALSFSDTLPTISFLMPSLKSAEKAYHWLSFYFFSFLLFSPFFTFFFIYFLKRIKQNKIRKVNKILKFKLKV